LEEIVNALFEGEGEVPVSRVDLGEGGQRQEQTQKFTAEDAEGAENGL
jgi:hypothetical protein